MKALVLAGGRGTRLRPYTMVLPKPLMPVGDYPVLEITLRQLRAAGVRDVVLAVGYMSQLFRAFFEDGRRLGLNISYSFEEEPLGTAGPISNVIDELGDDFIITNGDLLTTLDYRAMFDEHRASGAAATIGLYNREVKIDYGVLEFSQNGELAGYKEKPVYSFEVSMGVNVLHTATVREYLTRGKHLDIPDLMMRLVADRHPVRGFRSDCYWLDIGRVDDYKTAIEIFDERQAEFLPPVAAQE